MANNKSNVFENELLLLIFNNDTITLIGDAAGILGSAADGDLFVSLHTADPGEAGDQTTNECAYGSYARVAVARTTGGWTIAGNQVQNPAAITFPQATSGSETATHMGIGVASTAAGKLLFSFPLGSSLAISTNITPEVPINGITGTEE
jgi:hypothetical protein